MGDEMGVFFFPDYIDYHGTHYLNSVVSFSRSNVEARSKAIYDDDENFHIYLEIEDIVKIESQWCAQFEVGTVCIYFISKDTAEDDTGVVHDASGLHQLKFPAVDPNLCQKIEAIESLDARYKALWSVLLDTGTTLPAGEAAVTRRYFPNFDRPFEEVIYPKGDPDAVSISKSDVDLLLPETFVNDTIIDFYIKYLRTKQNADERTKFHFFNSFFFRKLADMDRDPSSAFDGKAAFQRVRKWTRKVNLLEKDFIFIPVNYSYHWSLIVICYLGDVASYKDDDNSVRVPCVLHMDSLRGNHLGLKDLIQSYLWEEWKERQKGTCEDLYTKFRNLKFVPLELPQQPNSFDCGLFLLHYVELFLEQVPPSFNIYKIASSSKFLQADWFPPGEASLKRAHIERLVNSLLESNSEDCCQHEGSSMHCSRGFLSITHDYGEGVDFSVKLEPLNGYGESSVCQLQQGIEMTLLPASSVRPTQCTMPEALVLKELFKQESFKQESAPEPFKNASWGAFESQAALNEIKKPSLTEVEHSECFATGPAGPVFLDSDCLNAEARIFPCSSEDFRLETVHQPSSDVDSSPETSGCDSGVILEEKADETRGSVEEVGLEGELVNAGKHQSLVDIGNQKGDSVFLEAFSEFSEEVNELPNQDSVSPAVEDKSNHLDDWRSESADEEHIAKRMRMSPVDLASDMSKDELHL